MPKLTEILTSKKLENEGSWGTYAGVKWKVARASNPDFVAWLRENEFHENERGNIADPNQQARMAEGVGRFILRGWEGLQRDDESPWPYSVEDSVQLMRNPDASDLYLWVLARSMRVEHYRQALEEEMLGN